MSSRDRLRRFGTLGLVWSAMVAAGPARPALEPVPRPALDNFEAAVRRQLERERSDVDALIATPATSRRDLGEAFGRIGRLYFVYDLADAAAVAFEDARALMPDDFRWHYYLGALAELDGRPEAEKESLERALALRPDDLPTLVRLGQLAIDGGRLDAAAGYLAKAHSLAPGSAAVEYGLGRIAFARKSFREAIEHFERALASQPEATAIHHLLGLAYRAEGNLDRARTELAENRFEPVTFADPLIDDLSALVQGTQVHLKAGDTALHEGRVELAVREYRRAIAADPKNALAEYNLGVALLKLGRGDEAIEHFRAAIGIDPGYRDAHYNLASVLADQGRFDEAAEHFRRAYEIDPEDQGSHVEWALALAHAGDATAAASELSKVLAAKPDDAQAALALAGIRIDQNRLDDAERLVGVALAHPTADSREAVAHRLEGELLARRGRADAALAALRKSLALDPEALETHRQLALLLARSGRYDDAAREFGEVLARAPQAVDARFGRAMAWMLAGEDRQAKEELERGIAAVPDSLPLQHALARLLAASPDAEVRDGARALELAQSVLDRQPTFDHAETLAMALAEAGRFADAVSLEQQIVAEAERRGDDAAAAEARRHLELYRAGKPCRAPWRGRP